ncbi:MAG TPA: thioredoxin domain-containing protein [Verrucomicrobiae bacterium]|nr:thioredoxin domain-containing protein [Verrucomicrobiae bacterium]
MLFLMFKVPVSTLGLVLILGPGRAQAHGPFEPNHIVNTTSTSPAHSHTNRLAREKSPYLLQHQFNPVDWYAWGQEAFEKARRENKPIFLSIGYSTCHWCHVMERESFENQAIAGYLNEHFVSIKVDREERPDVDKIYMTFVQATTSQGGWPLNVFLTPALKPFFGGTYFPPAAMQGRPGFLQLLQHIEQLWQSRQGDVLESARDIHSRLQQMIETNSAPQTFALEPELLRRAGAAFKETYDARHGGFGGAPKFPQPSQPRFLLRYAKRFADAEATRMVLHTCDAMASGGIHDQLGGGFARYSVDAEWLVPHFEKMLYDNAQLAQLYLDAYLVSGQQRYADVARDIIDYVLRDLTNPAGGFYSAEDADSEGHEGKFYCWTYAELSRLLSPEEFNVAVRYYGVTERGNFIDHSNPHPLPDQNVLSVAHSALPPADRGLLASARRKMLEARAKRVRPHLDDKVLASWNGLMLGAIARAAAVLNDHRYREAAERNLAFLKAKLWDPNSNTLYHRWRDGEHDQVQLLDAYSFLLEGVLDLYEATVEPQHLEFAVALAQAMLTRFYDSENGGFWQSAPGSSDLILRVKEEYDGAEPSGNSVALLALLRLGKITENNAFAQAADKSLRALGNRLNQLPRAVPYLLQAADFFLEEPRRAVLVGEPSSPETLALLHAVHSVYQPNKIVLGNRGPVDAFSKSLRGEGAAVGYVCTGTACQAPTSDPAKLRELLQ